MVIRTLIMAALVFRTAGANGDSMVSVELSPEHQIVKAGQSPTFEVVVRATSAHARVVNYKMRKDLRDNYAVLFVTRDGKPVDVPVAISDPGPLGENDFVEMSSGQELRFIHDGSPLTLSRLASGAYSAKVLFRPHPRAEAKPIASNLVTFEVSHP